MIKIIIEIFYLIKGILRSPRYWTVIIPLLVQLPYIPTLRQGALNIAYPDLIAFHLIQYSLFFSIICQTYLNVYEILHINYLPVTQTPYLALIGRLAATLSTLPWLYSYAFLTCYLFAYETFLLEWEGHALILSVIVATLGLKFVLPSSIVLLVLLIHLCIKLRIALLLSAIIILASTLKPLSGLMNKLLSVKASYLAETPVIILSPLL